MGRPRITRKNTAKVLSLPQGLQVQNTRTIDYCQFFMHVSNDFNAAISKLWLLRQRYGRRCGASFGYFS